MNIFKKIYYKIKYGRPFVLSKPVEYVVEQIDKMERSGMEITLPLKGCLIQKFKFGPFEAHGSWNKQMDTEKFLGFIILNLENNLVGSFKEHYFLGKYFWKNLLKPEIKQIYQLENVKNKIILAQERHKEKVQKRENEKIAQDALDAFLKKELSSIYLDK